MPLKMVRKVRENIKDSIEDNFKKIPLTFIPNKGQIDSRAKYYINGSGYSFYFTSEEVIMTFVQKSYSNKKEGFTLDTSNYKSFSETNDENIGVAIALQFIGASSEVKIEGFKKATGKVNYFKGKDQTKWITELSTYEKIIYKELWDGIDLVFYGIDEQLKYEFILRSGASVDDIKFSYKGPDSTSLDEKGNILIHNPLGVLIDECPKSYQEIEGEKIDVGSNFAIQEQGISENIYGFEIGDTYNSNYPLIIDPAVIFSTFLGGSNQDVGNGIAVDCNGSAYVIGTTESFDFPITLGAFQEEKKVPFDSSVFVTKLNSDGSSLVYSTYLDGSSSERGRGIAVDDKGNAYVTGETSSSDFPIVLGAFQEEKKGDSSAFMAKLNSDGSSLVYSTYLGGSGNDSGFGIAVDDKGNAYVTGETFSSDFPVTLGAFQGEFMDSQSVFVTKINSDGTNLVYSTFLGGSITDFVRGIAVDNADNAYVIGFTLSSDFPVVLGSFQEEKKSPFETSAFVTKLNSDGSSLIYSTYLGGSSGENGFNIAVDDNGSAYVTGFTLSSDFPVTLGAFQQDLKGIANVFVTKLNPDGSRLIYSTFIGGSDFDIGVDIAVDCKGNAYVTGQTQSSDFPVALGAFQKDLKGSRNVFVTKLNPDGSRLVYSTFIGGSNFDDGFGIAVDDKTNAYVAGRTDSGDFPITLGAFQESFKGDENSGFVTKLNTIPTH